MKRSLPFLAMAVCGVIGWIYLHDVDGSLLHTYHATITTFVARHPIIAPLLAMLAYAAVVAGFLPIALWMTLALGFAFGTWWGGVLSIVGATAGALATYLAARTSLGRPFARWAGPWLGRVEKGFRHGMWSYLLVIRLVPVMPFWLANICAALLKVPVGTYLVTTAVGIAPATFVLAGIGAGLSMVFARDGTPDLDIMTEPGVVLPLLAVSALALVPVAWRNWRRYAAQ